MTADRAAGAGEEVVKDESHTSDDFQHDQRRHQMRGSAGDDEVGTGHEGWRNLETNFGATIENEQQEQNEVQAAEDVSNDVHSVSFCITGF